MTKPRSEDFVLTLFGFLLSTPERSKKQPDLDQILYITRDNQFTYNISYYLDWYLVKSFLELS